MIKKTLINLSCLGLLFSLAACSPEEAATPSTNDSAAAPSSPSEGSVTTPSGTSDVSDSPDASASPTSAPASSADSAATAEIPSVIHGKWIFFVEGEKPKECSEELEGEGTMITIDATTISSFAFFFELESIEESDADSMEGLFTYQDDSDELMTPKIRLETKDGWQTLEFIELDTEGQDPAMYARCS